MAFRAENLSALTYANGFTLWHYRTGDIAADVDTSGYFAAASSMLRVGDFLFVNVGVGATPGNGVLVVTSVTPTTVDVANMTAFGTLNSD